MKANNQERIKDELGHIKAYLSSLYKSHLGANQIEPTRQDKIILNGVMQKCNAVDNGLFNPNKCCSCGVEAYNEMMSRVLIKINKLIELIDDVDKDEREDTNFEDVQVKALETVERIFGEFIKSCKKS